MNRQIKKMKRYQIQMLVKVQKMLRYKKRKFLIIQKLSFTDDSSSIVNNEEVKTEPIEKIPISEQPVDTVQKDVEKIFRKIKSSSYCT